MQDTGDIGSTPGSGRSLGVGNGNPLQYSCLGNPMDRGAWQAIVHGVAKSLTLLSTHAHTQTHTRREQLSGFITPHTHIGHFAFIILLFPMKVKFWV